MPGRENNNPDPEWQLRKYLLLLAILVATVTYVAGLDPPGGVWLETKDGHRTGNPILPGTHRVQHTFFYYSNATSFATSLVVSILVLFMEHQNPKLSAVGFVMVTDMLCLMVAYVSGSCRDHLTIIFASVLCAVVVVILLLLHVSLLSGNDDGRVAPPRDDSDDLKEQRKVLMLLAIFVTAITYTAGLNAPGGFWEHAEEGHHAGDPILLDRHRRRFMVFLWFNTAAFAASLVTITMLLSRRLWGHGGWMKFLYVLIAVALLCIVASYAAGSSREMTTTVHVLVLLCAVVFAYIFVAGLIRILYMLIGQSDSSPTRGTIPHAGPSTATTAVGSRLQQRNHDGSLEILLLATLAATVTYQAGLSPPGGVWRENGHGHSGGDLILPATHTTQYQVFFYCNSAAFVTSIVVILMVQNEDVVSRHALKAAVILDLIGLIGAYVAGSCRDVLASVYVLAAAVFLVVVILFVVIICMGQDNNLNNHESSESDEDRVRERRQNKFEKRRKLLLLLAVLAVTITYQAGLSPPGKFWLEDDKAHHVGDPVLADNYPRRYKVFINSNTISFMVSVAIIMILVGLKRSEANRKYWQGLINASLFVSLIGLAGLLVAYAVGTTRKVKTSSYVIALVALVFLIALVQIHCIYDKLQQWFPQWLGSNTTTASANTRPPSDKKYRMRKYLMLVGILAASVTYQAGLDPPGGVWPRDGVDGHAKAGDPSLHDGDPSRYHSFFYSNSTCFVVSVVVVIAVLLQSALQQADNNKKTLMAATHTAVVLDLLGLLVAFATGSSRNWRTSGHVLAMAASVLAYVAIYVVLAYCNRREQAPGNLGAETNGNGHHRTSSGNV